LQVRDACLAEAIRIELSERIPKDEEILFEKIESL